MACLPCEENPQTAAIDVGDGNQVRISGCAAHLYLAAETYLTGRRVQRAVAGYPKDPEFRCPRCRRRSASAWDAVFGYCAHCQAFTC